MPQRGRQAILYYDPQWTDGAALPVTATWYDFPQIGDISFAGGESDAGIVVREIDWGLDIGGVKDGTINFSYFFNQLEQADSVPQTRGGYKTLVNSWMNYTPELFALMNGPIGTSDTVGWRFIGRVKSIAEERPADGAAMANVSIALYPGVDNNGALLVPTRLKIA